MDNSLKILIAEDRRLQILKLLEASTGYQVNAPLMQSALSSMGHSIGMDQLETDISWLEGKGYLIYDTVSGVILARITQSGLDVATGRAIVPGVKRPQPE